MKRFVWLILAVFCTALAQVQPVDVPAIKAKVCSCCQIPGGCETPRCCPPPAHVPAIFNSAQPVRTASLAVRREREPVRRAGKKFYAPLVEPVIASVAIPASALAVSAASVPLFKAHCSFLI
jgi:hypothetical protein